MKKIVYSTLLLLILTVIAGCNKDESTTGAISLDQSALYVATDDYGAELYTSFTHYNIVDVEVYTTPLGWEADVYFDEEEDYGMVTVYAPSKYYTGMDYTGDVVLRSETSSGSYTYSYLEVGMVDFVDLEATDQQANSMIVSAPNTVYLFNPNLRGESSVESTVKVTDCALLWRSASGPIRGVKMYDNMIGFYTSVDEYDIDDDDDETDLIPGNAVIVGIADSGVIVWSWHIWVTDETIEEVSFDGNTFMDRNIGALGKTNRDDEETLEAYGLYYQWGRKDPFIQPLYYNAAGALDAYLYTATSVVTYGYYQSNASTGFLGFATANPGCFIGGTEESNRDWLLPSYQSDDMWGGVSGEKSIYDPSPRGWRVPTAEELAAIAAANTITASTLKEDRYGDDIDSYKDNYENLYAATFSDDSGADNLFIAAGRRAYMNGTIQNYIPSSVDSTLRPWVGYYWSRDAASNDSDGNKLAKGMRFYLEGGDNGIGDIHVDAEIENYRAMGMQIRCVKN